MLEDFKFLLTKDTLNNLNFISVDSVAGYLRVLADRIDADPELDPPASVLLHALSHVFENIEDFTE